MASHLNSVARNPPWGMGTFDCGVCDHKGGLVYHIWLGLPSGCTELPRPFTGVMGSLNVAVRVPNTALTRPLGCTYFGEELAIVNKIILFPSL